MSISGRDLSFDQAREIYSALLAGSSRSSQKRVFGELNLSDRKLVVRAIEVLFENKKLLEQDSAVPHPSDQDPLLPAIHRLQKGVQQEFTNKQLLDQLEKSKPLAAQGRIEIVLANRFLFQNQFLEALKEEKPKGWLYLELEGICDSTNRSNPQKQEDVITALATWIKQLDPGEGKRAAEEGLERAIKMVATLTPQSGFNRANLQQLVREFKEHLNVEVVKGWTLEPLKKSDKQAMEVARVGLAPLMSKSTFKETKRLFEETLSILKKVDTREEGAQFILQGAIENFKKWEAELLPMASLHSDYAVLYSRIVGEHANLLAAAFPGHPQQQEAVDLKNLQHLYAMSAYSQGNGEGALYVAEGLLHYGDWSVQKGPSTEKEALEVIEQAIKLLKKSGDKPLLHKAMQVRADILKKRYMKGIEFRSEPEWSSIVPGEKKYGKVAKAYTELGYAGAQGLFDLFLAGASADPLVDLLSRHQTKPTSDDIKMLTTVGLSGNKRANDLLYTLRGKYEVPGLHIIPYKDAFEYFAGAFAHLENRATHDEETIKETVESHRSLQRKLAKLVGRADLPADDAMKAMVAGANANAERVAGYFNALQQGLPPPPLPVVPSQSLFTWQGLQSIREFFTNHFPWFKSHRVEAPAEVPVPVAESVETKPEPYMFPTAEQQAAAAGVEPASDLFKKGVPVPAEATPTGTIALSELMEAPVVTTPKPFADRFNEWWGRFEEIQKNRAKLVMSFAASDEIEKLSRRFVPSFIKDRETLYDPLLHFLREIGEMQGAEKKQALTLLATDTGLSEASLIGLLSKLDKMQAFFDAYHPPPASSFTVWWKSVPTFEKISLSVLLDALSKKLSGKSYQYEGGSVHWADEAFTSGAGPSGTLLKELENSPIFLYLSDIQKMEGDEKEKAIATIAHHMRLRDQTEEEAKMGLRDLFDHFDELNALLAEIRKPPKEGA